MGLRGAKARFVPNCLVFPGGAVDKEDAAAPAEAEPRPEVLAQVARGARPRLARALLMAAARELDEETSLHFGRPPRLDGMDYLCRAVTPPTASIRFNARFFVAPADAVSGSLAGSGELENLRYIPVQHALTLDLMLVTREVLQRLLAWLALTGDARRERAAMDVFRHRNWERE